jgi:hypothetical protein
MRGNSVWAKKFPQPLFSMDPPFQFGEDFSRFFGFCCRNLSLSGSWKEMNEKNSLF